MYDFSRIGEWKIYSGVGVRELRDGYFYNLSNMTAIVAVFSKRDSEKWKVLGNDRIFISNAECQFIGSMGTG
jgi:hypothetical protein